MYLVITFDDGREETYMWNPNQIAKDIGIESRRMYDLINGNIKSHKNIAAVRVINQKFDYCTTL